jgi:hypothetical protein
VADHPLAWPPSSPWRNDAASWWPEELHLLVESSSLRAGSGFSGREGVATVAPLRVERLLQNPLGDPAPSGSRGDLVRISDGETTIYLLPDEYDAASDTDLRYKLAQAGTSPRPDRKL